MTATKGSLWRRAYHELIGYGSALRRFRVECGAAFDYLRSEFGFAPPVFDETSYGALCRFTNSTTVVEIHLDWAEELILAYVRPAAQNDASGTIGPPGVLLDAIMIHRGKRPKKQEGVLKGGQMLETLREYAQALRADASETLRGDFRELVSIRRARPEANWRLLTPRE